jgi:predicted RNase H-like nuclease
MRDGTDEPGVLVAAARPPMGGDQLNGRWACGVGPQIRWRHGPSRWAADCFGSRDWETHRVRYLGVDLAWGEGSHAKPANRSGVVALERDGRIVAAGWTIGLDETVDWIEANAVTDTLLFVDAPLIIDNEHGQRIAERQVGQRYGRWWVSANSTNTRSPRQAGMHLRQRLQERGWCYDDGLDGPPDEGQVLSECYPYTTIVGVPELAYDDKRPAYKRAQKGMKATEAWPLRTAACDELIRRIAALTDDDVAIDLRSHALTAALIEVPSPASTTHYKRREDLLDAAICAWTAALWHRYGEARCQVLGVDSEMPAKRPIASIIAPARPQQRRP